MIKSCTSVHVNDSHFLLLQKNEMEDVEWKSGKGQAGIVKDHNSISRVLELGHK